MRVHVYFVLETRAAAEVADIDLGSKPRRVRTIREAASTCGDSGCGDMRSSSSAIARGASKPRASTDNIPVDKAFSFGTKR